MSEYTADLTEMLLTAAEPEPHIVIAADRSVLVPDDLKEIAAQFDHNIETVTFDCPRYWDGHDFSKMHVFVNYRCADGKIDSYPCDPPAVDAEDETIIHFDWTLSRNVTCAKGVISFLVCVKSSDENGVLQNQWSSRLNQEMKVLEGIECNTEEIIPDEPDVIERILNRLDALERNGGGSNVNAELPFTENEISGVASGGGFVVNPTNFADGKTYFRYHAGSTYGFRWENPNKQKGSLTITVRGYSQYSNTLNTRIVTVYTDGSDNGVTDAMYLRHGETITYTTDPNKTVDYIRGNYDFENWVLLDMDALSIVADYLSTTGTVKSVNGILPDENGNVEIEIPEGGGGSGGSGGSGGGEWTKLGDITVSDTFEFNPISFTGGVVTLDTNAEGYSFMNQNRNAVFHPIDITSNINPKLYQLRPKDYAAGTFDVYNLDGQAQTSASMDITKYKMSVPNIGLVEMNDIPYYDRYKVRFTFPTMCTHGLRGVFGGNVGSLYFGGCVPFERSGGVIMEHELFTSPYDPNYMVRRSTVVFGYFYGMGAGATWEAVTIVQSGEGKTHPVNGVVNFQSGNCPFVNGSRFELWGANDV